MNSQNTTCRICLKHLSSKQNLKQHMNIHSGEKPYKCNFEGCENTYRHASQLSNHRLAHHQMNSKLKPEFDDIRAFIVLVLKALGPKNCKNLPLPEGPFTSEDSKLPPISGPQYNIRLPNFK